MKLLVYFKRARFSRDFTLIIYTLVAMNDKCFINIFSNTKQHISKDSFTFSSFEIKISEYLCISLIIYWRNYKWYTTLGKCLDIQICRVGNNISICLLPRYFSYWHFISIPRQFMRVLISSWLCTRFTIGSPPLLHTSGEMLQVGR